MLTNLDFLEIGNTFPPNSERERLQTYQENISLFNSDHDKVYKDWIRILREENNSTLHIILNWHKRLSTLWADLLLGEPPRISVTPQENQDLLQDIVRNNNLIKTAYEVAIDMSRCGAGIFKVRYNEGAIIETVPPTLWFPVVRADNIKDVLAHVLAWVFEIPAPTRLKPDAVKQYLRAEIHEKGKITNLLFKLEDGKISKNVGISQLDANIPETEETGIDEFLVIPAINSATSDDIYGTDDYKAIDTIMQEMEVRLSQISKILDRHADPNMYGPRYAIEQDASGRYIFRGGGKYFPVESGETPPGYIVWDSQLTAAFKELDVLMQHFYAISETSPACFGDFSAGFGESGTALRRMMQIPLAKVNRMRLGMDPAIKKALKIAMMLEGKDVEIDIGWNDGLPQDEKEMSQIYTLLYQNGLVSRETAIRRLFEFDEESLQRELGKIQEESNQEIHGIMGNLGE